MQLCVPLLCFAGLVCTGTSIDFPLDYAHDAASDDGLSLVQKRAEFTEHEATTIRATTSDAQAVLGSEAKRRQSQAPFKKAFVVSMSHERYAQEAAELENTGVESEMVHGYNGTSDAEVAQALKLLRHYGHAGSLHDTVSNWFVCMHTSPGKPPHLGAALSELLRSFFHWHSPRTVDELLQRDSHGCVGKVIAIAAAHVRLWRDIADGSLPSQGRAAAPGEDPWYLVMEDDVSFCPGWRSRMLQELPMAPADADVIKLFFFGHWRSEDEVPSFRGNLTARSPFLEAKDPLRSKDLVTSALYEVLHGAGWKNVPAAGFYAGTQAYLIRPSGARKLLAAINGKPFQDIDMTMLSSVKNYVWRRVLVTDRDARSVTGDGTSLLQTVPTCNTEPPRDQF